MTWLAGLALLTLACGGSDGTSGKGPESAVPADGKLDSFRQPTHHGKLLFGIPSEAAFTADDHFHSWEFELSAGAEVALVVEPGTPNLDTVMYLYKHNGSTWGRYLVRNDDDGEKLRSAIRKDLAQGRYRVLVKAYKEAIRGHFALEGTCQGNGCPGSGRDDVPPLGPETGISQSCLQRLNNVLLSPTISHRRVDINRDQAGSLPALERASVQYYYDYFGDWMDIEEEDYYAWLTVETTEHIDGTAVSVEVSDSDEMGVTFVYDQDDKLIMYAHSEQSPTQYWFCAQTGEETFEAPDDDCFETWLYIAPHDEDDVSHGSGSAQLGALGALVDQLKVALTAYGEAQGLAEGTEIDYEYDTWTPDSFSEGGEVTVSTAGQPTYRYLVSDDHAFMRVDSQDRIELVCKSYYGL
jgi:hypothetical protein